jgi:hypothetical protein
MTVVQNDMAESTSSALLPFLPSSFSSPFAIQTLLLDSLPVGMNRHLPSSSALSSLNGALASPRLGSVTPTPFLDPWRPPALQGRKPRLPVPLMRLRQLHCRSRARSMLNQYPKRTSGTHLGPMQLLHMDYLPSCGAFIEDSHRRRFTSVA